MTRRNIELMLLLIASPIVIVLFAMMVVTGGQELSFNTLGVPLGIFAAFLVAHIAVRLLAPAADPAILPISFALSGVGIAFVTRIVPDLAVNQLLWLFIGIAAMIATLAVVRNLDKLANYKYTLMIVGILLLLSPMLPVIGYESGGGQLWLRFGSFSFQPGELAKILIVFFIAAYLAANREMLSVFTWKVGPLWLPSLATLLPLIVMWALAFIVVVLEKDLGLALVLFSVFVIMLYVATGKKLYLVVSIGLAAIAAVALYGMMGHVQTRVAIWQDPFAEAQGGGFQLVQSLYSIADGDLFGTGIGRGMGGQPVAEGGIPVAESDFIFPVIAEETGLLGAAGVLLLYLCFAIRGIVTAARAKSDVSSFTAVGLTSIIVLQAFIIVGGVTRLIPLTGITLPFISQGGSSLLGQLHHRRLPAALRRRGHGRGPGNGQRHHLAARQQRAGPRVAGQAPEPQHALVLRPVRAAGSEPHAHHGGAGRLLPEHAGKQPYACERSALGARHHRHVRRRGVGAQREGGRRHLRARVPGGRLGQSRGRLLVASVRQLRHREGVQRHAERRRELRIVDRRAELVRRHRHRGKRRDAHPQLEDPASRAGCACRTQGRVRGDGSRHGRHPGHGLGSHIQRGRLRGGHRAGEREP